MRIIIAVATTKFYPPVTFRFLFAIMPRSIFFAMDVQRRQGMMEVML